MLGVRSVPAVAAVKRQDSSHSFGDTYSSLIREEIPPEMTQRVTEDV